MDEEEFRVRLPVDLASLTPVLALAQALLEKTLRAATRHPALRTRHKAVALGCQCRNANHCHKSQIISVALVSSLCKQRN